MLKVSKHTLLIRSLQHPTDLQDISLRPIGPKSVPSSIETQNNLDRL